MKRLILSLLIIGCLFSSGCGDPSRPKDLPKLYPVKLTFTQEGKPLENAMVVLKNVDPSFKWSVMATTDATGLADIVSHGQFFGAPEGQYKITVIKEVQESAKGLTPQDENVDPAASVYSRGMITVYTLVEKQYTTEETTPIEITVSRKKADNIKSFEVGKSIRELSRRVAP